MPSAGATSMAAARFFNCRARHHDAIAILGDATRPANDRRRSPATRLAPHRRGGALVPHSPTRRPHRSRAAVALSPSTAAPITGFAGDTLASGAARQWRAPGRPLVQISPAARHPVGRLGGAECAGHRHRGTARAPTPNLRATQVELYEGLTADQPEPLADRCDFDVGGINDRASPVFCRRASTTRPSCGRVGFWEKVYEPRDPPRRRPRPRAGGCPTPIAMRKRYAHCDVLVVGAGPAGLAAALAAAESGAARHPVRRADRNGRLAAGRATPPASTASRRPFGSPRHSHELAAMPRRHAAAAHHGFRLLPAQSSSAWSSASPTISRRLIPGQPRERLWQVRAKEVVLATGAIERPLVFPDNDRPGIMLADARACLCQPLWRRYRVAAPCCRDGA